MSSLPRHIVQKYQEVSLLQERAGVGTWLGVNAQASHLIKICRGGAPRFQQEFNFLSNTSQKHFPKALKHSFKEGEEIYVREYIAGQPLGLFFGEATLEQLGKWLSQISRALAAIHFRGMVHGDISGNNILVDEAGHISLIDFEFLSPRHQDTMAVRGTPAAMAPEIFMGAPPTIQTDLYSVGCLLYALIAGHYPFPTEQLHQLVHQHILELPPDPTLKRQGFPKTLGLLILRLLAKEPGARWAEANDIIRELNQLLSRQEPLEASPKTTSHQQQKKAAKSFSLHQQAIQYLKSQLPLKNQQKLTLAELLLKAGSLQELEDLIPKLEEEAQWLYRGLLFNRQGRYEDALKHFSDSEPSNNVKAIVGLATSHYYTGQLNEALETLMKAEDPLKDSPRGRFHLENFKGNLFLYERRLSEAEDSFQRALENTQEEGAIHLEALVLMNLANVQVGLSLWEKALENYQKSLELFQGLGQVLDQVKVSLNYAGLLRFMGHLEKSKDLIDTSLKDLEETSNQQLLAYAYLLKVDLEKKLEKLSSAASFLDRVEKLLTENPTAADGGDMMIARAEIHFSEGRDDELLSCLKKSLNHAKKSKDSLLVKRAQLLQLLVGGLFERQFSVKEIKVLGDKLCEAGDFEFVLDNLKRAYHRAQKTSFAMGSELIRWAQNIATGILGRLPQDYHSFFRHYYPEFFGRKTMKAPQGETIVPLRATEPHQLQSVLEWVRELTGELNLQELTQKILQRMLQFTHMERGFVILQDEEQLIVMHSHQMNPQDFKEGGKEDLSWSLTRQALERNEPLMTTDAQHDTRLSMAQSVHSLQLRSMLVLPFRYRGQMLGAVYLDSRLKEEQFDRSDLPYLMGLADILGLAIHNASRFEKTEQELEEAQTALRRSQEELEIKYQYKNIIGRSPLTQGFLSRVDRVTDVRLPVLILGESGVGKELVAKAIHFNGPMKKGSFVAANCSAIPEALVESEFFGHERGAFTGAIQSRAGLFEQAHEGTLFLDEIGDMPLSLQAKLLRVLQEGEIRRVGGNLSRKIQVRIMAATHRDLKKEVLAGNFREDLFYRLSVAEIRIPALRERREDIPLLVSHFLDKFSKQNKVKVKKIDPKALSVLMNYSWPGNIRELENLIYNLCIFSSNGTLTLEDLRQKPELLLAAQTFASGKAKGSKGILSKLSQLIDQGNINLSEAKRQFEKDEIKRVLAMNGQRVGEAAKQLGIPRPQLSRLLRYHQITRN